MPLSARLMEPDKVGTVNVPPIVAFFETDKPVPSLLQINVSAKVPLEKQSILCVTSSVPLVMLTPLLNSQTLS